MRARTLATTFALILLHALAAAAAPPQGGGEPVFGDPPSAGEQPVLLAPARWTAPESVRWAEVEPLVRACFTVRDEDGDLDAGPEDLEPSSEASLLQGGLRSVISQACEDAMEDIAFDFEKAEEDALAVAAGKGKDAGTTRLREALFAQPRTVAILRRHAARSLDEAGIKCADCAPKRVPGRVPVHRVRFADLVPYLVRFVYVSGDDLEPESAPSGLDEVMVYGASLPPPVPHFHVCTRTNGLRDLPGADAELSWLAYAAVLHALSDERTGDAFVARIRTHVAAARAAHPGPVTRDLLDRLNGDLERRLAADDEVLGALRAVVAEKAEIAGLACVDCAAAAEKAR